MNKQKDTETRSILSHHMWQAGENSSVSLCLCAFSIKVSIKDSAKLGKLQTRANLSNSYFY